jgi:hypothetical protein
MSLTIVFDQSRSDISNKYLNNFFTYMPCVSVSFHFRISKRNYVRKLKLPILRYSSLCRPICKLYLWPWLWSAKMWWPFEKKKNANFSKPFFPDFRNRVAFCKVLNLRLLVLLVKAACQWKRVWSDGGKCWEGKTEAFGKKPVPLTLCPPQISHGVTWNRTGVPR